MCPKQLIWKQALVEEEDGAKEEISFAQICIL